MANTRLHEQSHFDAEQRRLPERDKKQTRKQMHRRLKAMQYRQNTPPKPQSKVHPEAVYCLQQLLQGAPKTAENRRISCQKYAV